MRCYLWNPLLRMILVLLSFSQWSFDVTWIDITSIYEDIPHLGLGTDRLGQPSFDQYGPLLWSCGWLLPTGGYLWQLQPIRGSLQQLQTALVQASGPGPLSVSVCVDSSDHWCSLLPVSRPVHKPVINIIWIGDLPVSLSWWAGSQACWPLSTLVLFPLSNTAQELLQYNLLLLYLGEVGSAIQYCFNCCQQAAVTRHSFHQEC